MSVKVADFVWQFFPTGGSDMLVMMALADFGNDNGGSIYPSVRRVADKTRLSVSQCRRVIHRLIDQGLVEVVGNHTGGGTNSRQYRIRIDRLTSLPHLYDPKSYPRGGGVGATPNDSDSTSADASPLVVSPGADATPEEPATPSADATPQTVSTGAGATPSPSADERAGVDARGGADASEGWRPCAVGLAPVRDRGGAHASLTVNNRQEPLGTVSKAKRERLALPDWLDPDLWKRWDDYRKAKARKAWTLDAQNLSLKKLAALREADQDLVAVVEQSIARGWSFLFTVKPEPDSSHGTTGKFMSASEKATARRKEVLAEIAERAAESDANVQNQPTAEALNDASQ